MIKRLTLRQLKENKTWENAVIVFSQDSFSRKFTEEQRSYKIKHDDNYFNPDAISNSLYGNCLDGTDNLVRLDVYMGILPEEGKRWIVEYCYITK